MKFLMIMTTVFYILLFNGGVIARSVDELEKILAAQFVEAFDMIILNEKRQANNTKEINLLKIQVEDLKKE